MSSKTFLKTFLAFVAMVWLSGNPAGVLAQVQARPEAGPFDASRLTMQPPPPEGVAIRAIPVRNPSPRCAHFWSLTEPARSRRTVPGNGVSNDRKG